MTRRLLVRLALRMVPRSWRETVASDLDVEARTLGRGALWIAWHTLLAAARLRSTTLGDLMWTDVRYAVRSLLRARWFTGAAVLTLALGIGVNLAVFTVVDRILFRPLPVRDVGSLVLVGSGDAEQGVTSFAFDRAFFVAARHDIDAIEDLAFAGSTATYALSEDPADRSALRLTQATYNLLEVLGTIQVHGRPFSRDDVVAARQVALITHEVWWSKFSGEDVLGRRLGRGNARFEIIGVLPPGFLAPTVNFGGGSDGLILRQDLLEAVGPRDMAAASIARLRPETPAALLRQQVDALAARLDRERPLQRGQRSVGIESFRSGVFGSVQPYFLLLSSAAAFVWLMAAANLGGLLLARGRSREHVAALQTAIGASRRRVMAAALTESVLVSGLGTVVALFVVWLTLSSLRALVPSYLQPFTLTAVDYRLAAIGFAAGLGAALVAGLLPAWRASRLDVLAILQRAPVGGRSGRLRGGQTMLAVQAAFAILLVAGAAVMVRNLAGFLNTDFGFEQAGLYEVGVTFPAEPDRARRAALVAASYPRILAALRGTHGILAAGATDTMPASGATMPRGARFGDGTEVGVWQMSDGFIDAIGGRFVAGRDFDASDVRERRPVSVITRNVVERLWPGMEPQAAIGRMLEPEGERPRQVVGVIDDLLDAADRPALHRMYVPAGDPEFWLTIFAVRATAPPDPLELEKTLIREAGVTGVRLRPADVNIIAGLQPSRLQATLFSSFAAVALMLASVGLYATTSLNVALRRAELGIRIAMGADRSRIHRLLIVDALRPVLAGAAAGLAGTYWAAQFAQAFIHQVDARDPWTLALVVVTLVMTALLAAWIPARRAARTDPAVVLRQG